MSDFPSTKESAATGAKMSTTTATSHSLQNVSPAINESWRLFVEHKWTDLQMRLGVFPNEARAVQLETKRSLLHEIVSTALAEKEAALAIGSGNQNQNQNQQQQQQQQQTATKESISSKDTTRWQNHFDDSVNIEEPRMDSRSRPNTTNRVLVSPLFLRSIYFSCPQAMLLQESEKGYTPLHSALTLMASTTVVKGDTTSSSSRQQQKTSFGVIDTLLELCQGQCITDSDHDWFEESKEEEGFEDDSGSNSSREIDEDDVNERAVFLLRDHRGDTPLHTACRHGCSKHILQILMEACPSALCQSNRDGVTPLRLLWNDLEEYIRSGGSTDDGVPTKLNADKSNEQGAAKASVSASEAPQSPSELSILENILENKIKTYDDLTKYPDIKETWEKSVTLLHILQTWDQSSNEEFDSAIDGLMDHDIFRNFLMRRESRDFLLSTTSRPRPSNESHQHQQVDFIKTKRKQASPVVEIKSVVPDEKGMIPMPSCKRYSSEDLIEKTMASHHGSMHAYLQGEGDEVKNLFFERD